MSLIDSLLIDPYPFHVWITIRSDAALGSGTVNDPYDGSSQSRFDNLMALIQTQSNVTIHLGAGTFQTQGYSVVAGAGWQAKPGMKIIGSGIDVTVLKLVNAGLNEHYYAIGHSLSSTSKVDYFEVSDLTVDSNLPSGVTSVACGAIRILGDHAKIHRVKAKNWGTTAAGSGRPCYVFSVITALPDSGVSETVDSGIEDCMAVSPSANNAGQAIAFHVGSQEDASPTNEGFAQSPYIRNCFVDCGVTPDVDPANWKYRGLSMGWCRGGVVEGNSVRNTDIGGPYQDKRSARDIIVRNCFFKNVARGPNWNLGVLGSELVQGTVSLTRSGNVGTVSGGQLSVSGLAVGDRVKIITSAGDYNGVYVITTVQQSPAQFTVTTPATGPSPATVTSVKKVFGLSRAVVEGNLIELVQGVSGVAAVFVDDNNGTSPYAEGPDYVHGDIIIRNNKIGYVDGVVPVGASDLAFQVNGAKNLIVSNNVVDSANSKPLQNQRCGSVKYFNDLAPNGSLIQGFDPDQQKKYSELATDAEDAFVLAFLEKR